MFECEPLFVAPRIGVLPTWWLDGAAIDLDFDNNRYYDSSAGGEGQSITSYISCSRASTGYATNADGTLTSFATDTLRRGVGTGLLVEGARTNLLADSIPATGTWANGAVTLTQTSGTSPDGTNTAVLLTATAGSGIHRTIKQNLGSGTTDVMDSFYAKAGTASWVSLSFDFDAINDGAYFNLGAGTVGTVAAGTTATIEALANGWYRCCAYKLYSSGNHYLQIDIHTSDAQAQTWTAAGTETIYVWGAQQEAATFHSSYIPTTGTAATRAADAVSCIGNLDTLLKAADRTSVVDLIASATPVTWDIISGSSAGNELIVSSSDVVITSNTATKSFSGSGTFTAGVKVGAGTSGSATSVTGAGLTVATGASGTANTGTVYLGSDGTNYWYGYFPRATFWNSKIADATLQGFTNP